MTKKNSKNKVEKIDNREQEQFVKQIREEARKEAFDNFVAKYWRHGVVIVLSITIISIITISASFYQKQKRMNYASELNKVVVTVNENNYAESEKTLKNIVNNKKAPNEIKAVAGMHLGNLLVTQEKLEEAISVYSGVVKATKDAFVKEIASLMKLNLMIRSENPKYDGEIKTLITKLTKEDKTLNFLAKEQKLIFDLNNVVKEQAKEDYNNSRLVDSTENSRVRMKGIYESYTEE